MFDDLIFSLTGRGKIIGIQIRNFSNLLNESGVNFNNFESIKEVSLIVLKKENSLFIGITLISKQNEKIQVPLGRIFIPQIKAVLTYLSNFFLSFFQIFCNLF